jgi:microsomal dipeptidase-like Zn-dependent dipeptidase
MWISYEVEEDLPYLMSYIGEEHLVVGTDYGHHTAGTTDRLSADPSAQIHLVTQMRSRDDISSATAEKILRDNPTALYGV